MKLIISIALIVYAVKHTSEIKQQEKLIIEKGVHKDIFDIYIIGVWFYFFPPLIDFILQLFIKQIYLPLILALYLLMLAALYLPAVITGSMIYKKFDRGFDYERRIGNKISQTLWIGYIAIVLIIGTLLISIMIRLF